MKTFLKSALVAAVFALATPALADDAHHPQGTAQAQPQQDPKQPARPGPGPGSAGMPNMMGQGSMMGGGMPGMMQMMQGGAHMDGRLAFLKAELKITPDQEKAWNDFATALRQVATKSRDSRGMMMMGDMSGQASSMSPPQMLEQYEKHLIQRLDAVKTMRTALVPFYAVLSDAQKNTLAELHPMFVGMM
jgi:hypothetical protein